MPQRKGVERAEEEMRVAQIWRPLRRRFWRGLAASCKGHYQDAIKVLEMVKRKDDPVLLTYLGYHHRKLGDVDLGIILYKQALDVDPENVDTRRISRRRICDRGTTRSGTS
jgi:tetratricopeptide (TPR) repeat protein